MAADQVLGDARRDVIAAILDAGAGDGVREAYVTLADRFREEGRQELMQLKLGPPPDAARERVARASGAELAHWAERILVATAFDEVFGR